MSGIAGRIAGAFIDSKLTPLFIGASLLAGLFSIVSLPREEEPQIIVPMIDVFVAMPGAGGGRGGGAGNAPDGETPVGDSGRGVCLFDLFGGGGDGDCSI